MKLLKKSKILIVGLGLIGGSYAAALTKKGYQVYALTKEEESIEFAKGHNYIIDGKTEVDEEFISSFDIWPNKASIFDFFSLSLLSDLIDAIITSNALLINSGG